MSVESAKAKLDAQPGDPATGYISKADHQDSYTELVDDTALTGATTAEALTISGNLNGRDPDNLVAGPGSSTDNALVRFDGTGGKTVQGSGITVDDSNNISGVGTFGSGAVTSSGAVQAAAAAGFVVGSSGPRVMSGTGSPEGVVTAPVGSTWIRTDGATLGDFRYSKRAGTGNTGWVVADGDTGSRDISSVLTADADRTLASTILLRRTGNRVVLTGQWRETTSTPNNRAFYSLPVGFRPAHTLYQYVPYDAAATTSYRNIRVPASGNITYGGPTSGSNFEYYATWVTNEAWPSSLPGSAA